MFGLNTWSSSQFNLDPAQPIQLKYNLKTIQCLKVKRCLTCYDFFFSTIYAWNFTFKSVQQHVQLYMAWNSRLMAFGFGWNRIGACNLNFPSPHYVYKIQMRINSWYVVILMFVSHTILVYIGKTETKRDWRLGRRKFHILLFKSYFIDGIRLYQSPVERLYLQDTKTN